ncbi:hypothetical protein ACFO5K_04235 [Nocardia halotolerans]|uniref:Sigma-70, region 4 n=1 Tax=Nocardia halotolerans TaxID=1755878 RepID=A0ABV8VCD9_9NOCA
MHDPMSAFPPERPEPADPWESLAAQARALADLADQLAARDPADLAPTDGHDPLAELDERALAVRGVVAACRRATWQSLVDGGLTGSEIGRRWDTTPQNVSQVLRGGKRAR